LRSILQQSATLLTSFSTKPCWPGPFAFESGMVLVFVISIFFLLPTCPHAARLTLRVPGSVAKLDDQRNVGAPRLRAHSTSPMWSAGSGFTTGSGIKSHPDRAMPTYGVASRKTALTEPSHIRSIHPALSLISEAMQVHKKEGKSNPAFGFLGFCVTALICTAGLSCYYSQLQSKSPLADAQQHDAQNTKQGEGCNVASEPLWRWCDPTDCARTSIKDLRFDGYGHLHVDSTCQAVESLLGSVVCSQFAARSHTEEIVQQLRSNEGFFMATEDRSQVLFMCDTVRIRCDDGGFVLQQGPDGTLLGSTQGLPVVAKRADESPRSAAHRLWTSVLQIPISAARFIEERVDFCDFAGYSGLRCVERTYLVRALLEKDGPLMTTGIGLPGHEPFSVCEAFQSSSETPSKEFCWISVEVMPFGDVEDDDDDLFLTKAITETGGKGQQEKDPHDVESSPQLFAVFSPPDSVRSTVQSTTHDEHASGSVQSTVQSTTHDEHASGSVRSTVQSTTHDENASGAPHGGDAAASPPWSSQQVLRAGAMASAQLRSDDSADHSDAMPSVSVISDDSENYLTCPSSSAEA